MLLLLLLLLLVTEVICIIIKGELIMTTHDPITNRLNELLFLKFGQKFRLDFLQHDQLFTFL